MALGGGEEKQLKGKRRRGLLDADGAPKQQKSPKKALAAASVAAGAASQGESGKAAGSGKKRKELAAEADALAAASGDAQDAPQSRKKRKKESAVGQTGAEESEKSVPGQAEATGKAGYKKRKVDAASARASGKENRGKADAKVKGKGKGNVKGKDKRGPDAQGGEGGGRGSWSDPKFRVFVHNLGASCDEAMLRRDFSDCGELADVYIPTDKATGKPKGFAFVNFKDMAGVEAALEYDGTDYGGRTLKVKRALEKGQKPETTSAGLFQTREKPEGCTSIVCKRLSREVTRDDLEDFFSDCGAGALHVGLLRDKATGRSRCTARVDFKSEGDVEEAMSKVAELRGQAFFMDYCKPKDW